MIFLADENKDNDTHKDKDKTLDSMRNIVIRRRHLMTILDKLRSSNHDINENDMTVRE